MYVVSGDGAKMMIGFYIENKDIGTANRYKKRTQREPAGGGDV